MVQGLKSGHPLQNGTYRIEKVLGQGSFGITYLAKAKFITKGNLGTMNVEAKVAIKEFFMSEVNYRRSDGNSVDGSSGNVFANYRKKFKKEAENLSKLDHPNIVKVFDVFDENNTTYYVMEFLEGTNLDDYIKRNGSLSEDKAIFIIKEIGGALAYMHSQKMLHLDIKPKNIMRNTDGKDYLIDFGLSKQFSEDGEPESSTSIGLGTPGYAPIEQSEYKQDGTFPATLDVYALGATMFKMLSGKKPPEATCVLNDGFPNDELGNSSISRNTISVVKKAMQPFKKKRYQSVSSFLEELENREIEDITIIATPIKSKPTSPFSSRQPPKLKYKWNFALVLIAIAVIVVLNDDFYNAKITGNLSNEHTDSIFETRNDFDTLKIMDEYVPLNFVKLTSGRVKDKVYDNKKDIYTYPEYNIDGFYIDAYELTQGEYKKVMGEMKPHNYTYESLKPKGIDWGERIEIKLIDDNLPVLANYRDFVEYCNKRSIQEGYDGFYIITPKNIEIDTNGNGYRLPTALEWTFAAKGGILNEQFKHIGGNDLKEVAWYGGNSGNKPHPVGKKKPNGAGLYDMAGNIQELHQSGKNNNSYEIAGPDYMTWKQLYDDDWWSPYCTGMYYGKYDGKDQIAGCRIVFIPKGIDNKNLSISSK